jgi:pimeloyl-ACP methyl ester carboxylesterase
MAFLDTGIGFPVVLVHGLRCSHQSWRHQIAGLAGTYRVIAPDLWGHGASDTPTGPYSMDGFASAIVELLRHLRVERAFVVGHSMGGGVAQALALDYPDRVAGLVLVAAVCGLEPPVRERMVRAAENALARQSLPDARRSLGPAVAPDFARSHPDELDREASLLEVSIDGFAASSLANAERNTCSRLHELGEVLWLGGEYDRGEQKLQPFRENVAALEYHVLPNVGHYPPMEAPQQLNALMDGFFRRVLSTEAPAA